MARSLRRRDFTKASLAASALAALPPWAPRASAAPGFRLGLVTYNVARDWDLDTILRVCREARIEGVELRTTHAHGVERTLTPAQRRDVRQRCRDAGLLQTSLGTVCEFHSEDPAVVRRNVEDCREWVLLAKDLGARGVKVRPNGLPKGVPEEKTIEQIGRALAECGAFAKDQGVEIWCEVHGDATKEPSRMRKIMDVCSHPSVGVTWNSNDSDMAPDGTIAASFALLRPFILCCHITDIGVEPPRAPEGTAAPPSPAGPPKSAPPYPYRELFAKLRETSFGGFTLCEYPQAVPPADGTAWMSAYRRRWEALQA